MDGGPLGQAPGLLQRAPLCLGLLLGARHSAPKGLEDNRAVQCRQSTTVDSHTHGRSSEIPLIKCV